MDFASLDIADNSGLTVIILVQASSRFTKKVTYLVILDADLSDLEQTDIQKEQAKIMCVHVQV